MSLSEDSWSLLRVFAKFFGAHLSDCQMNSIVDKQTEILVKDVADVFLLSEGIGAQSALETQ